MYESGCYPLGAGHNPRALWNKKESHHLKCESCNGKGYHYYAYNFEKNKETECTLITWNNLPDTEEEAFGLNQHYIRGERKICEICDGQGEVEYEEDYEPDYDDYYER